MLWCNVQFMSLYGVFNVIIRIYHTFQSVCNKIICVGIVLHCFCRTLGALLLYLAHVAKQCHTTGMPSHNLAFVWAPITLHCWELKVNPVAAQLDILLSLQLQSSSSAKLTRSFSSFFH